MDSKLSRKQIRHLIFKCYYKYNNSFTFQDIKNESKNTFNIILNISDVDLLLNKKCIYHYKSFYSVTTIIPGSILDKVKVFDFDSYDEVCQFHLSIIGLIVYKLFYYKKIKRECLAENIFA